jgi:hypothetical protein
LANDVASDGITANAVLPGLTNTVAVAPQSDEQKRATWEQQAIKRLGEPEDVTGAVLFLTSDDAAFITGQAIVVDGGQYRIGWVRFTQDLRSARIFSAVVAAYGTTRRCEHCRRSCAWPGKPPSPCSE